MKCRRSIGLARPDPGDTIPAALPGIGITEIGRDHALDIEMTPNLGTLGLAGLHDRRSPLTASARSIQDRDTRGVAEIDEVTAAVY